MKSNAETVALINEKGRLTRRPFPTSSNSYDGTAWFACGGKAVVVAAAASFRIR